MGLFNRLPRELRDMVYQEVLGNDFLFLSWFQPRGGNGYFAIADRSARSKGKFALLKTCRNIYVEAIPILYSSNTFGFAFNMHTNTPHGFFHAIPSQYLATITSIYIACKDYRYSTFKNSWYSSVRKEHWIKMWSTIATEMPMLKDVKVKFGETRTWCRYLREPGSKGWMEWFHSMAFATPKLGSGVLLRFEIEVNGKWKVLETMSDLLEAIRRFFGPWVPWGVTGSGLGYWLNGDLPQMSPLETF